MKLNLKSMVNRRFYSNNTRFSSQSIRENFIKYFVKENGHKFIKSSSVIPYCDPTLQFVNAGMNQFKSVFLGQNEPIATKAANYQKCIRVGGKHNDLDIVGSDGYHHTFFEMLGNWSFGDYFKKEACELSWKLLTELYGLNPKNLYVTYFGGDVQLNLQADMETYDIWRSIGVQKDHIIPFGPGDNFWEMGLTGPCGPCTEIHIDHTNSGQNRAQDVNKNLSNLTELWNIVFIQYNRDSTGKIEKLSQNYVDTGMGFERLTAILQGKKTNYETDLFTPIFVKMHKESKATREYGGKYGIEDSNGLDTAYRIIADHARMTTACLADGMLPEENYKLRKIIRRAMILGNRYFSKNDMFFSLACESVIDILGPIYPEMDKNKHQVKNILEYETHVLRELRSSSSNLEWLEITKKQPELQNLDFAEIPTFILGYKDVAKLVQDEKITEISGKLAYKLYDTYGLDTTKISEIGNLNNISVDIEGFEDTFKNVRNATKQARIPTDSIPNFKKFVTNDEHKYDYSIQGSDYVFKNLKATLLGVVKNSDLLQEEVLLEPNEEYSLIFDKTNLYVESGGQETDSGWVYFMNSKFQIKNTTQIGTCILHTGFIDKPIHVKSGLEAEIEISKSKRLNNMKNHTATHILNSILRNYYKNCTIFQKSSRVNANEFKFDFYLFGPNRLQLTDLTVIENQFRKVIQSKIPVNTRIVCENELDNVILVPGEVYPSTGLRLIEICNEDFVSKEACCGTHLLNTKDVDEFCITNIKQNGRSAYSILAATGNRARDIIQAGMELQNSVDKLIENCESKANGGNEILNLMKQRFFQQDGTHSIPYTVLMENATKLTRLKKKIDNEERASTLTRASEIITKSLNQQTYPWLVHNLEVNCMDIQLSKLTKLCGHLPVFIIINCNNSIKARACVPKHIATDDFNAEKWLKSTLGTFFTGNIFTPKGQNSLHISNMTECEIVKAGDDEDRDRKLQMAIDVTNSFASDIFELKAKRS